MNIFITYSSNVKRKLDESNLSSFKRDFAVLTFNFQSALGKVFRLEIMKQEFGLTNSVGNFIANFPKIAAQFHAGHPGSLAANLMGSVPVS